MEKWKKIEGYEYWISNQGRMKNKDKVLKLVTNRGYHRVGLYKNGKPKHFLVHRLVAIYFIENTNNKPIINHKNGVKKDNRVENLEWCTDSENKYHAYANNLNKGKDRKPCMCLDNGMKFHSTFFAARWLDTIEFKGSKRISIVADKIRCACRGIQKTAYNRRWKYIK